MDVDGGDDGGGRDGGQKRLREDGTDEDQPAKKAKTEPESAALDDPCMVEFKRLVEESRKRSALPDVAVLFQQAAAEGELQRLKDMVACLPLLGVKQDCVYSQAHDAALKWAAHCGHTEVVAFLLELGIADTCVFGDGEDTSLMLAAESGHAPIVRLLLDHHHFSDHEDEVEQRLDDHCRSFDAAVVKAVASGLDDVLLALVESSEWKGIGDERVASKALKLAVSGGRDGAVRLLLEHGPVWAGGREPEALEWALVQATGQKRKAIMTQLLTFDRTLVQRTDVLTSACRSANAAAIEVFASEAFSNVCAGPLVQAAQDCGLFNHTEAAWSAVQDLVQSLIPHVDTARLLNDVGPSADAKSIVGVIESCCNPPVGRTSHRKLCNAGMWSSLAKAVISCLGDGKDLEALFGAQPTPAQRLLFTASVLMRLSYKTGEDAFWIDFTSAYANPDLEPQTVDGRRRVAKGQAAVLAQLAKGLIESTMGDVLGDLWNCCAEHDNAVVSTSSSSQSATQETLEEFLCKRGFSTAMASRIATSWRKAKGDKTAFCNALKEAAKSFPTNWQAQSGPVKPPSHSHGVQAFESCQHFTRIEQQMLDTAIEQMLAM